MWKKLGLAAAALLVIIAGVGWYLFSNLDSFIQQAIEKYGSAATQADVNVSGVQLSLNTGSGSINGLVVGNPAGFSTPHALALGGVAVQLDTASLPGTGPIIINEVTITNPQVTYEVRGLDNLSNLKVLQGNVQAYANTGAQATPQSSGAPARTEIIRDLTITGGEIGISATALGGKALTVPLPTIHLTNIGQGHGGASPAEITREVLGAITNAATKVSATALANTLASTATGALKSGTGVLSNGAGSVTGAAKGLLSY